MEFYKLKKELLHINKDFKVCQEGNGGVVFGEGLGLKKIPEILLNLKNYSLFLRNNQIKTIQGLKQDGLIDLSFNKIINLDGFCQKGSLELRNNKIINLKGFVYNKNLPIKINSSINVNEENIPLIKFLRKNDVPFQLIPSKYNHL